MDAADYHQLGLGLAFMTRRSPGPRGSTLLSDLLLLLRSTKSRAAPRLTDAIRGSGPESSESGTGDELMNQSGRPPLKDENAVPH